MAKMSRRAFLTGSAAAVAVVAFGSWFTWRRNTPEAFVKHAVLRNMEGWEIAAADLDRFTAEYLEAEQRFMGARSVRLAMRFRQAFFSDTARKLVPTQQRYEMAWLERRIVTRFVQSTDILFAAPDNRKVTYLRYWDPYTMGCANTLARYDYD